MKPFFSGENVGDDVSIDNAKAQGGSGRSISEIRTGQYLDDVVQKAR